MAQQRWPTLVPLGALVVSGAGSTVALSKNCGSLGGQLQSSTTFQPNAVPGTPFRQLILTNKGSGNAFLLPVGQTAAVNTATIIAYIPSGQTIYLPNGQPFENGILPENYVLDGDGACTVYGCGIIS